MITTYQTAYSEQINREIEQMPDEYLPMLHKMIRLFRESVTFKPAEESFRQGWKEAMLGETAPIFELWAGTANPWLLMDALYADGPLQAQLKYEPRIEALVRLPEDQSLCEQLMGLLRPAPHMCQEHLDTRYCSRTQADPPDAGGVHGRSE